MKVRSTVGFIGTGGIAPALAKGFCGSEDFEGKVYAYDLDPARTEPLRKSYPDSVVVAGSNRELVDAAEFVFPTLIPLVLEKVAPKLNSEKGTGSCTSRLGRKSRKRRPGSSQREALCGRFRCPLPPGGWVR